MAIELFKKDKPDFILMDVQMPIMNGYEATAKIREIENTLFLNQKSYKSIPIIGITAGIMRDEKTKCLEAGMNDFMAKPIINNIFISLIRKWILR
ncbi:response regulator [Thalassobellus suaedae]|uniref:Response regulator n=1 Tax=Thalassobellus suaedae TaxID=3074124 RepID=A0ABY9XX11_9FLAO|nr:response regulator [Flavobacteriaceae bacterium HL-DH14]